MKTCATFTSITLAFLLSFSGDTCAQSGQPTRLTNVSTRMKVLTGNDVMIAGFVVGGSANKTVAIVATGPSLTQFGVDNPLANPTLTLVRSSDQATIAANDDWQSAPNAAAIQASGFAPSNALEPAILMSLAPGAYTAVVSGVAGGTGVAVVGAYEVAEPAIPLVNISTRGKVMTGGDVMIGGFVIDGTSPKEVVIVATGPSLTQFGITDPLPDPTITLVRSTDQAVIAANDNWEFNAAAELLQTVGFAPPNPLEAAMLVTLAPGPYTAVLSGVGGTTGTAVLGVYEMPAPADWPPRLISSSPAHTEMAVSVTSPVQANFSKPMDPATLTPATFTLVGPIGPATGSVAVNGNQATFTPTDRLLTEATYTGTITTGARDLAGRPLVRPQAFSFQTRATEPPPIVAGCPAPESDAEVRRLAHPAPPKVFVRGSGYVTSFRIPRPGSIRFLQGQTTVLPAQNIELTVSRCPGVTESNLHPLCRLATTFGNFALISAVDRPLTDNQDTAAGCLAPSTEQYYVNVRWTFASPGAQGGFSIQWAN